MKRLLFVILFFAAVQLSAQSPLVSVPFIQHGDHIFVQLEVDDSRELDFIFDSGDSFTVIDINVARELDLKFKKTDINEIVNQLIEIKHNKVEIRHFLMESNIKVYAASLDHLEISIGRNVDGIIGYDLLRHHDVRIDYDNMVFEVYDQGKSPSKGEAVPFKLDRLHIPVVTATVTLNNDEVLTAEYFVNTGAGTTMDFNAPYASANRIADKTGDHYSYFIKGIEEEEHKHYEGRVKSFQLGSTIFENLPIGISESQAGLQNHKVVAGIIGNRVLRKFNITFNYGTSTMYLEQHDDHGDPILVNCSGIDVQLSKDKTEVLIHQVFEKGPAIEAGIQENDILVEINGKDAMDVGLIGVEEILKKAGESVDLIVRGSDGTEKKVTLQLEELI